jgi:hypothetical protein
MWAEFMRRKDAEGAQQFYPHVLNGCPECLAELNRVVASRRSFKRWLVDAVESTLLGATVIVGVHLLLALKGLLYDPFRDEGKHGEGKK